MSLGLLLLDGILWALIWFSASHVSRAAVHVIWKVFRGFSFAFPAGHVSWAIYLLFGWYSAGWFVLFTCLVSFGYHHVDFLTVPGYHTSSVSILSYCYSMVHASLPVACEAHLVEMRVWRSRWSSSSGICVMEIGIKVFVRREQSYGDPSVHLAGFKLWRSESNSLSGGNKVTEIWIELFVHQ